MLMLLVSLSILDAGVRFFFFFEIVIENWSESGRRRYLKATHRGSNCQVFVPLFTTVLFVAVCSSRLVGRDWTLPPPRMAILTLRILLRVHVPRGRGCRRWGAGHRLHAEPCRLGLCLEEEREGGHGVSRIAAVGSYPPPLPSRCDGLDAAVSRRPTCR